MKFKKGDFTLVPNKSLRDGMAPKLQVIYMWLCDYSDDNYESYPSRSTLAANCGISVRSLDDGLKQLEKDGYIKKEARFINNENTSNLYTVNIFAPPSAKSAPPSAKNDTTPSAKSAHRTQPNTNSTQITQSTSVDAIARDKYGRSTEINELFQYWESTVGVKISSRIQPNRNACNNLIKKYGVAGVRQLIVAVQASHDDKYAPRISDFSTLQSKLNELLIWAKKKGTTHATARF